MKTLIKIETDKKENDLIINLLRKRWGQLYEERGKVNEQYYNENCDFIGTPEEGKELTERNQDDSIIEIIPKAFCQFGAEA